MVPSHDLFTVISNTLACVSTVFLRFRCSLTRFRCCFRRLRCSFRLLCVSLWLQLLRLSWYYQGITMECLPKHSTFVSQLCLRQVNSRGALRLFGSESSCAHPSPVLRKLQRVGFLLFTKDRRGSAACCGLITRRQQVFAQRLSEESNRRSKVLDAWKIPDAAI